MPPALITFLFATRTAGGTGVKQNFAARKRAGQLDQKRSQLDFFQVVEDSRCNQEDRIGSLQLPQPLIVDERACDRLPPPAFLDVPLAQLDRVRQVLIKLMFREMLEKS
jgi:hypothetical protein